MKDLKGISRFYKTVSVSIGRPTVLGLVLFSAASCGTAPQADQSYQIAAQDRIDQISVESENPSNIENSQDATRTESIAGNANNSQSQTPEEWQPITNSETPVSPLSDPSSNETNNQIVETIIEEAVDLPTQDTSGTTEVFPIELVENNELPPVDPIQDLPEVVQELPEAETPEQPSVELPAPVVQPPPPVIPEVPEDPIFELATWNFNLSGGAVAQNSTQGNALTTTIQSPGSQVWNVQPTHLFDFKVGSDYEIEIQAYATQNRPINVKVELRRQPWTNALDQNFNLTESSKTFKVGFNYNGPSNDMRVSLNYGGSDGDVYIEKILIREVLPE